VAERRAARKAVEQQQQVEVRPPGADRDCEQRAGDAAPGDEAGRRSAVERPREEQA